MDFIYTKSFTKVKCKTMISRNDPCWCGSEVKWKKCHYPQLPLGPALTKQYLTDYVAFTDRVLPSIQDPIQKSDPRIVFCVAWAKGGYLPTHNPNYRLPQGPDPVWNNANCRNRRLFNDRAVKKVAANTKPFLLQTYRRDMGGGNFVLMKDVSAPIKVAGRHWGGFRIGFKV